LPPGRLRSARCRRLGRALALRFAEEGINLVIHYNRSGEAAEDVASRARRCGVQVCLLKADLARPAEADRLIRQAIRKTGGVDILINSASLFPESRLTDFSADDLQTSVQLHAMAPLQLARGLAAQGQPGDIINLLDARIATGDPTHAAYHLGKRLLADLTRLMAREFAPLIQVNAVAPGAVLPPPGRDETYLRKIVQTVPLRRTGNPEGLAHAVLFLLQSDFITGQTIFYDGGHHLKGTDHG